MPALEQGDSSNCTNPELDVFHRRNGVAADLYLLEFIVYELETAYPSYTQTYPPTGRATVDLSDCPAGHRLALGRYVAEWDVPAMQVTGRHVIRWFWKSTAPSPEQQWEQEFVVLVPGSLSPGDGYCTVQDLRDEGFNDPPYTDARVQAKILDASRFIEKATRRWFEPRSRVITVRAKGTQSVFLDIPIVQINEVSLVYSRDSSGYEETAVDLEALIVYNRHLTQGLEEPDDRDVPRITFPKNSRLWRGESVGMWSPRFPDAYQVVKIDGVFGYTELVRGSTPGETAEGSQVPTSQGITPPDIVEVCKRLTARSLPLLSDTDGVEDARNRFRVTQEKTREQSISMTSISVLGLAGAWTGDPMIDEILANYVAPPDMGLV